MNVTNDFIDKNNSGDSSILKARLIEQDIAANQKLQEVQGAADEFARQAIINELKQAEFEREKLKLELEQEASSGVDNILSHVELSAAENEDNFTSGIDGLLAKLFKFFNFMDSELGVETDPQIYRMVEEREKKEDWLAAIIKFLRDKFNKLIKAIFSRDLSFQQKIDKEIEKLFERLFGGGLSQEEEVAILERLEALRDLKLKLQMFAVGWVISTLAGFFSVDLVAAVETGTTKEEDRKTKETSSKEKEATKEVHEIIEIKVDAKEKPTVTVPVSLFDFSSGVAKPIPLTKPEFDLLREPIRNIVVDSSLKVVINENREIKETRAVVKGNEQARKSEEPKKEMPAPGRPGTNTTGKGSSSNQKILGNDFFARKSMIRARGDSSYEKSPVESGQEIGNFYNQASSEQTSSKEDNNLNKEKTTIKPKLKIDDLYHNFPKVTEWKNDQAQEKVPSGFTGVKVDKCVEDQSAGKAHGGR